MEEALRQKVLRCKQKERSQSHPKWGPFKLKPSSSADEIEVLNSRGKKALVIAKKAYELNTEEYQFDKTDTYTYTHLCYAGPRLLVSQLREKGCTRTGLLRLSRDHDNAKILHVKDGGKILLSLDLSDTP